MLFLVVSAAVVSAAASVGAACCDLCVTCDCDCDEPVARHDGVTAMLMEMEMQVPLAPSWMAMYLELQSQML